MEELTEYNLPSTSHVLRTPNTPRTKFNSSRLFPEDDDDTIFNELLRQTWTIFGMSALFGFQYDNETTFKLYAKRLREEIANTLVREDVVYDAKFGIFGRTDSMSDSVDPPAIKVEIYTKSIDETESVEKCIYRGIFLTWQTLNNDANIGNSVKFPLLLCRGNRSCMDVVHSTLSRMFDCIIMALSVEEDDLMWLVPIVIASDKENEIPKESEEIRMQYTVPGLPNTDTITVKFRVLDLVKILKSIKENESSAVKADIYLKIEQITKFHEAIKKHFLEIAGVQLQFCRLHRISLPSITIMENRMKVMTLEIMNRVLTYLNEKALDTFHILHFDS